jgi:hypothetical protein
MRFSLFGLLLTGSLLRAAQPVVDETERLKIFSAIFPGARVVARPPYPSVKSEPGELIIFPDALQGQKVYRVEGATSKEEACAAENVGTLEHSRLRELRFVVYRWPKSADWIAVLQYHFVFADSGGPAGSCRSLGRIVHVATGSEGLRVTESRVLESTHHGELERIELSDISGDGVDELLVESDWGGPGGIGSSLLVFSLQTDHLEQVIEVATRLEYFDKTFTQVFDIAKTRMAKGKYCFVRTDLGADGQLYRTRRVSTPCYPPGTKLNFN